MPFGIAHISFDVFYGSIFLALLILCKMLCYNNLHKTYFWVPNSFSSNLCKAKFIFLTHESVNTFETSHPLKYWEKFFAQFFDTDKKRLFDIGHRKALHHVMFI